MYVYIDIDMYILIYYVMYTQKIIYMRTKMESTNMGLHNQPREKLSGDGMAKSSGCCGPVFRDMSSLVVPKPAWFPEIFRSAFWQWIVTIPRVQ